MIIGYCSNEGLLCISPYFFKDSNIGEEFIPPLCVVPDDVELEKTMMKKIRKTYQLDINPDNKFLVSIPLLNHI